MELDNKQNDPNRLFNSRKNNLLQEEAERKAVKRKLPKVERELYEKVEAYNTDSINSKSLSRFSIIIF